MAKLKVMYKWVGLGRVQSFMFYSGSGRVGSLHLWVGLGRVKKNGSTSNSDSDNELTTPSVTPGTRVRTGSSRWSRGPTSSTNLKSGRTPDVT